MTPVKVDTLVLDVVVPVCDEERDLEPCVRRLSGYLAEHFPYSYRITVADNGSTDDIPQIAARLAEEDPKVRVLRPDPGRPNTAANPRLTFGFRGSVDALRHQAQGLVVFGLGVVCTSGALGVLHLVEGVADRAVEVAVLTGANLVATVLRFLLFRVWVFRVRLPG